MNILVQSEPRSIALRGSGTNPFTLIFRHASKDEGSSNKCVVEFLPWKDVNGRGEYKPLTSTEVYGSLGLIDIDEGITENSSFIHLDRYLYLCHYRAASSCDH
jgi:hypothetical protein